MKQTPSLLLFTTGERFFPKGDLLKIAELMSKFFNDVENCFHLYRTEEGYVTKVLTCIGTTERFFFKEDGTIVDEKIEEVLEFLEEMLQAERDLLLKAEKFSKRNLLISYSRN